MSLRNGERGHAAWLNGYRADGTSVWSDDYLIFDGPAPNVTPDLFDAIAIEATP